MRQHMPSPVHRRINALLLSDDGWATDAFFIDAETVREYRRLYRTDGREGIEKRRYEGNEPALILDQLNALAAFDESIFLSIGITRQT